MVLEAIGRGRLVHRAVAQRRPIVSKLGLKGMSNYCSNKTAVKATRWGARGPNKKRYSQATLFIQKKSESWSTALSLTKQGQKAARQRKIPLIRKSYSLYLWVTLQREDDEVGELMKQCHRIYNIQISIV
jgi:hypothetical protein